MRGDRDTQKNPDQSGTDKIPREPPLPTRTLNRAFANGRGGKSTIIGDITQPLGKAKPPVWRAVRAYGDPSTRIGLGPACDADQKTQSMSHEYRGRSCVPPDLKSQQRAKPVTAWSRSTFFGSSQLVAVQWTRTNPPVQVTHQSPAVGARPGRPEPPRARGLLSFEGFRDVHNTTPTALYATAASSARSSTAGRNVRNIGLKCVRLSTFARPGQRVRLQIETPTARSIQGQDRR